jgi:hypothetical protein
MSPLEVGYEVGRMRAHLANLYGPEAIRDSFANELGDTVDCVDFRAQPGVRSQGIDADHGKTPSLSLDLDPAKPVEGEQGSGVALRRACPSGTVSLRHYSDEELSEYTTLDVFLQRNHYGQHVLDVDYASHEHASSFFSEKNWGATTTLNVWDPQVEKGDFSLSQLWVTAGERPEQQTVEAGWMASGRQLPGGDGSARLFIYSTSDGYRSGCYNALCDDFVKMPAPISHVVLDGRIARKSRYLGPQYAFTVRWQLCPAESCGTWEGWWLRYDDGALSEWVGFYPRSRFDAARLADQATRVSFGGEVFRPKASPHTTTDMGSGNFPVQGFGAAAYQRSLRMIAPGNTWRTLPKDPLLDVDNWRCYDHGKIAHASNWGDHFFFGGPGWNEWCR